MKLALPHTEIETSEEFKTEFFGIGDLSVLLEILRSKLYSDPIKIICQEIMSNARDAHREVGKQHVPIEVTLPNVLATARAN